MCDSTTILPSKQADLHNCWIIYTNNDAKEIKPILNQTTATTENLNSNLANSDTSDNDPDEDDENGQSWHQMLDPELQPEPPIPDNQQSQEIYAEHRRLAKKYLKVETKLCISQEFKEKILQQMDPEEQKEKTELLRKLKEKQELLELYNNLCPRQIPDETNQYGDLVPDDSWVVINRNTENS